MLGKKEMRENRALEKAAVQAYNLSLCALYLGNSVRKPFLFLTWLNTLLRLIFARTTHVRTFPTIPAEPQRARPTPSTQNTTDWKEKKNGESR